MHFLEIEIDIQGERRLGGITTHNLMNMTCALYAMTAVQGTQKDPPLSCSYSSVQELLITKFYNRFCGSAAQF